MTMFKEQRITCDQLQVEIGEVQLIHIFIGALNVEVFGNYKEDFYREEALFPVTLNEIFVHTNDYYIRKCQAFPTMANVLGDSSGYAVYATYGHAEEEESTEPSPIPYPWGGGCGSWYINGDIQGAEPKTCLPIMRQGRAYGSNMFLVQRHRDCEGICCG
jgi:hypothetical protein